MHVQWKPRCIGESSAQEAIQSSDHKGEEPHLGKGLNWIRNTETWEDLGNGLISGETMQCNLMQEWEIINFERVPYPSEAQETIIQV